MRGRTNRNRHLRSILYSPVLFRQLITPLEAAVRQAISEEKEKSWFPQFPVLAHLLTGIFFHVQQLCSLRELVARLDIQRQEKRVHGFEIKHTTLSNANNSRRRLGVLRAVFANLVRSVSTGVMAADSRACRTCPPPAECVILRACCSC